MMAVSFVGGEK